MEFRSLAVFNTLFLHNDLNRLRGSEERHLLYGLMLAVEDGMDWI